MNPYYHSTRNSEIYADDAEAVLQGLAKDGGLFVRDDISSIHLPLQEMMKMRYQEIALLILEQLLPSFTKEELRLCIARAYESFPEEGVTPLVQKGPYHILELFHGPTSAFKDVGLQMLPQLMSCAMRKKDHKKIMILTATSGDTGKAALEGFQDVDQIGITVFYPDGGVSDVQHRQMVTQTGSNTAVCAIHGNFDDAQSKVKEIFHDDELRRMLKESGIQLSSANSINIGRLIPQIVYYFEAYKRMVETKSISFGDQVNFCVPTGNFGNVLAGYYASLMGLPVHRFLVASNSNHILYDFLKNGIYDRRREFYKTNSPSMDILISSNLERLLYEMSGHDTKTVEACMQQLQQEGFYQIDSELLHKVQAKFYGGYAADHQTAQAIFDCYHETGYVMDPHTAVGFHVMKAYQKLDDTHPCILLSTASPYKFASDVYHSLFQKLPDADEFAIMEALSSRTGTRIPNQLKELKHLKCRHRDVISQKEMSAYVMHKAKELLYD